ncbi:hypothetical protein M0R45_001147 [Rubus argutus]|uniref:Uncharacterized protein n=1 Tax=Rubus argutus TaxID=59490 RepID=A0AAW1VJH7_RUBAR
MSSQQDHSRTNPAPPSLEAAVGFVLHHRRHADLAVLKPSQPSQPASSVSPRQCPVPPCRRRPVLSAPSPPCPSLNPAIPASDQALDGDPRAQAVFFFQLCRHEPNPLPLLRREPSPPRLLSLNSPSCIDLSCRA